MVIAVFPSLEGESLEDVSVKLAERWRIGHQGLDNGVILVVFVKDRKLRMEVGYGLEGVVTDAVAGQIIREAIAPRFREGRYAAGLEAAVDAVFARIEGKHTPAASGRRGARGNDWPTWLPVAFVLFLIASFFVNAARQARRGRHGYTAGSEGWYTPSVPIFFPPSGGGGSGGDGGFSGGGGGFGGGGASGDW